MRPPSPSADSGTGSFREALTSANGTTGTDTIAFSAFFATARTITLASPLPAIGDDLAINGPGSSLLTISGNSQFQILNVPAGRRVAITKARFANGRAPIGAGALELSGGAIVNAGFLTISDSIFSDNRGAGYVNNVFNGGAISNGGNLTVVGSQFSNNLVLGASGGSVMAYGGAIYNFQGSLTVAHCLFTNNRATAWQGAGFQSGLDGNGGAIASRGGTVWISHSIFTSNRAEGGKGGGSSGNPPGNGSSGGYARGGAVYGEFPSSVVIEDCVFNLNTAAGGRGGDGFFGPSFPMARGGNGGDGRGGAIFCDTLTIRRSLINSNSALGGDGGVGYVGGPSGSAGRAWGGGIFSSNGEFSNCTISQNSASSFGGFSTGGGVYANAGSMVHCTITGNTVGYYASAGSFGGIATDQTLRNNLIAGNTVQSLPSDAGTVTSLGHNLFGTSVGITGLAASDLRDVAALLGLLQDNGGPTMTHALLANSPALNAGDNTGAPTTDQRGETRSQGATVDIGAFETSALAILVDGKPALPGAYTRTTTAMVSLETIFPAGAIRYTLDGSTPTLASTPYTASFSVATTATIRAVAFDAGLANPVFAGPVILSFQPTITLTVSTTGLGVVARNPSLAAYPNSTVVTLTAMPVSGWVFEGWSGDIAGNTSPTTVTMAADKIVLANFIPSNDTDGDGLRDSWELLYWLTLAGHAANDDFDKDGITELQELAFGLNPLVPDSGIQPRPVAEGGYLTITLTKQPWVTYEVQSAGTLFPSQPESFSPATTTILLNNSTTLKVRDNFLFGTQPGRFMRVKVLAAP